MSDDHAAANPLDGVEQSFAEDKGKGKHVANDYPEAHVDEDDEEEEEEDDDDYEEAEADQGDDEGMAAMDLNNIVGRRTRGHKIDFAKAAEELGPEDDDDDDEDDEFQPPVEDTEMAD